MLYYHRIPHGNFGDALNPWIWPRLAPEVCEAGDPTLFLGIGTLLSARVPAGPSKVLFGSGCGPGPVPKLDQRWHVYGVRGPRTAARLGLPPDRVLSDPAILARTLPAPAQEKRYPLAFMPHHQSTLEADWAALSKAGGFHFIDPRAGVPEVLAEIRRTRLLLTEAMHGAIVADALRVPWIPVRLYGQIVEFKWRDWAESLGLHLTPHLVPPIFQRPVISGRSLAQGVKKLVCRAGWGKAKWERYTLLPTSPRQTDSSLRALVRLAADARPMLSANSVLARAEVRLLETLERVRADWREGRFGSPVNRSGGSVSC